MANNTSTFKRYELKYMLDDRQYAAFREAIHPFTGADAHARYTVCNLYYDTDQYTLIRSSLDKPVYKEKLRLRSYGVPEAEDEVFFELKKKYRGLVYKRRVSMPVKDLNEHLIYGSAPNVSPQVMGEIDYFLSLYRPQPKIFIAYDRIALKGRDDETLRITFDENIRFRRDDLDLLCGDYGQQILDGTQHLTEIKVNGAMPLWLTGALDREHIYPTSFSKYGYCYKHFIMANGSAADVTPAKQQVA